KAQGYAGKAVEVFEQLAAQLQSADARRDLAVAHSNLAGRRLEAGDDTGAKESYSKAFQLRQALVTADPDNDSAQWDLLITALNYGPVSLQTGDVGPARDQSPRILKPLDPLADTYIPPPRPLWDRAISYGGDFGTDSTVWIGRFPMPAMYASESQ